MRASAPSLPAGDSARELALERAEESTGRHSRVELRRFEPEGSASASLQAEPRTYFPALDGLRALAVCAVVAYHLHAPWLDGGWLGVSVFFTLSGYLITSLLVQEAKRQNSINLAEFWVRRARRLLPALLLMLTVVGFATAIARPDELVGTVRQMVWALLYASNWSTIASGDDYFRRFLGPGALDHLWSLAVEEQFYIVWPLVVSAMLRWGARLGKGRLPLTLLTVLLTAASTACMGYLYAPGAANNTRAYEGTDARAAALLVGALAALYVPLEQGARATPRCVSVTGALGLGGLLGIAVFIVRVDEQSSFLYRGGELVLSVCSALVAVAAVHRHTVVARALNVGPLRWVGARSYGLYLWHLPIVAFMPRDLLAHHPALYAAAAVTLLLVLTAASYHFIEDPVRRRLGVSRLALAARAAVVVPLATAALLVGPLLFGEPLAPTSRAAEREAEAALRSELAADIAMPPSVAVPGLPSNAAVVPGRDSHRRLDLDRVDLEGSAAQRGR
jgi:peptidoglycan/LPS O-acetylase OafA/YrhL